MKKLMIDGAALVALGSSRHPKNLHYLINDESIEKIFVHDEESNIVFVNANGHSFYGEVWELEEENVGEIASPQALLEMKVFAFVQHSKRGSRQKVLDAKFDIQFLVEEYKLKRLMIVNKHLGSGELEEVEKIIASEVNRKRYWNLLKNS